MITTRNYTHLHLLCHRRGGCSSFRPSIMSLGFHGFSFTVSASIIYSGTTNVTANSSWRVNAHWSVCFARFRFLFVWFQIFWWQRRWIQIVTSRTNLTVRMVSQQFMRILICKRLTLQSNSSEPSPGKWCRVFMTF